MKYRPDAIDSPWMGPERVTWLQQVQAWLEIAAQPLELGTPVSLTVVKERPWAAVLHARFQNGAAYSKAPGPLGRTEAGLLHWLQAPGPDARLAPRLLASRADTGWMLLADAGSPLRGWPVPDDRLRVLASTLARYASAQRRSLHELPALRALGLPELALTELPLRLDALSKDPSFRAAFDPDAANAMEEQLHALLPELRARVASLARRPWSTALEHGDLHVGNILVEGTCHALCDWGDAGLTHPAVSLGRALPVMLQSLPEPRQADALDTLLAAWSKAWDEPGDMAAELPLVLWLSHAVRALSYAQVFAAAEPAHRAAWMPFAGQALTSFIRSKDAFLDGELLDALRLPLA